MGVLRITVDHGVRTDAVAEGAIELTGRQVATGSGEILFGVSAASS